MKEKMSGACWVKEPDHLTGASWISHSHSIPTESAVSHQLKGDKKKQQQFIIQILDSHLPLLSLYQQTDLLCQSFANSEQILK